MERGEYIPFRDRFANICEEISQGAIADPGGGRDSVWVPPEPLKLYCRSVQLAVECLVACGALRTVEYTKASAW